VHLLETHFNTPELAVDLERVKHALAGRQADERDGLDGIVTSRTQR
jgi:hypothetical protein